MTKLLYLASVYKIKYNNKLYISNIKIQGLIIYFLDKNIKFKLDSRAKKGILIKYS